MLHPESTCWTVIRAAAAGSPADRQELARRYLGVVRAYLAARWRGSAVLGELGDAVQEVFVECFRGGGALEAAGAGRVPSFRAFLYGVVRNVARRFEARPAVPAPLPDDLDANEASQSRLFDRTWAQAIMAEAAQLQRERAAEHGPYYPANRVGHYFSGPLPVVQGPRGVFPQGPLPVALGGSFRLGLGTLPRPGHLGPRKGRGCPSGPSTARRDRMTVHITPLSKVLAADLDLRVAVETIVSACGEGVRDLLTSDHPYLAPAVVRSIARCAPERQQFELEQVLAGRPVGYLADLVAEVHAGDRVPPRRLESEGRVRRERLLGGVVAAQRTGGGDNERYVLAKTWLDRVYAIY